MSLDDRFEVLLSEITKQEEIIENYANKLEEAGNIDPNIEEYLKNTREELQERKQKLIEEFKPVERSKKLTPLNLSITNEEDSPKIKNKANTPNSVTSRVEKFPFYSVLEIEIEKSPALPKDIFKKHQDLSRGNSPSALRYSPINSLSPNIKNKQIEINDNLYSEFSSTQCSFSNFDRINDSSLEYSEYSRKYQELREIKNKVHEEMLLLKEKMLNEKESRLEAMMQYIESKSVTLKRGNFNDK